MQKYTDLILGLSGGVLTPMASATVSVTFAAGGQATLYSDNGVTPLANPFTSDSNGRVSFYAADGRYNITVTKSGYSAVTLTDVLLEDPVTVKDYGAYGNGVAEDTSSFSAASTASIGISVPIGTYKLSTSPTFSPSTVWNLGPGVSFSGAGKLKGTVINTGKNHSGQWPANVSPLSTGIYDYLESAASFSVLADTGIAITGAARASQGTGLAGDAHIAVAGFGYNDYVSGATGTWGFYSTNVRLSTATGPTQGMEIDVANLGSTQAIYPAFLSSSGLTAGMWIASGGEITNVVGDGTGSASCAIGIVRNDTQNRSTVNFDKGIVFGSTAISGTTGTSGAGIAIAFGSCHFMNWFNTNNQQVGSIGCNVQTAANGQSIQITDAGVFVSNVVDNGITFQIAATPSSVNRLVANGGATTVAPALNVSGSDTNIDLALYTKGTGVLKFGTYTAGVVAQAGYITIKDSGGTIRRLLVG